MKIPRKKRFSYVHNLKYPIIDNNVQKDLNDTDSIVFSRLASKKAVTLCVSRLEYLLANNLDDCDLDIELSNLYETLCFVKKNLLQ